MEGRIQLSEPGIAISSPSDTFLSGFCRGFGAVTGMRGQGRLMGRIPKIVHMGLRHMCMSLKLGKRLIFDLGPNVHGSSRAASLLLRFTSVALL